MSLIYKDVSITDSGIRLNLHESVSLEQLQADLRAYGLSRACVPKPETPERVTDFVDFFVLPNREDEIAQRLSLMALSSGDTLRKMPELA